MKTKCFSKWHEIFNENFPIFKENLSIFNVQYFKNFKQKLIFSKKKKLPSDIKFSDFFFQFLYF